MFIGLSMMEEEYFAGKVSKFIAIAPCIYTAEMKFYGNTFSYDGVVQTFSKLADQRVYKVQSFGEPISVNDLLYFEQIRVEDRF